MKKERYTVIGVMSGTSLDGVDIALCEFVPPECSPTGLWEYTIQIAETVAYSSKWEQILKQAIHFTNNELTVFNKDYTVYLAHCIKTFIAKNNIVSIDAVCSHGHTILHQPDKGITLQIGNLPKISEILQHKVVCDFRVQDVLLGGQGAPLVPIGDQLLFSTYDYCINLGGFANISSNIDGVRIAYDICPVNIVLNYLCSALGLPYDANGLIARNGTVSLSLLDQLNGLNFYHQAAPKSLGLEWVNKNIIPLIAASEITTQDAIATFTKHAATQIARQLPANATLLVTGGGAYNSYLIALIEQLAQVQIKLPSAKVIEFKEALIFGLLGVLKLRGETNCLASVTGASKNHSSGKIYG